MIDVDTDNYILDEIQAICEDCDVAELIEDFSYSIDQINSCQQRFTLRFCNELPEYYDIPIDEEFIDKIEFYDWLDERVRSYIFDAKAQPCDALDSLIYASRFIQNGRANGKTKILYNRGDNLGKYSKYFYNEKGNTDMATERYMSESEAWYDTELKKIETELNQKITEAQFEAQKKRCELESKFRALRIEEQEAEKASKRKAYYDGLIASGFTKEQAMEILLKELH